MPCWQDLIRSAVRNGARRDKFVRALVFAIKEVLGQEFASNVESRLLQADQESSTVPT
jgi:RNase P/RNase MRP subunit POP5